MTDTIFEHLRAQFLGTFAAPGSTFSVSALLVTLMVAVGMTLYQRRQAHNLRPRVLLRALFPRWIWKSRSGRADIGWFIYSVAGVGLGFAWLVLATSTVASWMAAQSGDAHLLAIPGIAAVPLSTLAIFLAFEFAYWFDHLLMHKVRFLWMFHRVHHSAEHLSLLTNFRVHPVETILYYNLLAIIVGIVQGVLPILLGPAAAPANIGATNILVLAFAVVLTHLQHSHLWVRLGPFWGRYLLGPAHHQLHHSEDQAHYDCNFGSSLTLFDRAFGTFLMPGVDRPPLRFGIGTQKFDAQSLYGMTIAPFAHAASALGEAEADAPRKPAPTV